MKSLSGMLFSLIIILFSSCNEKAAKTEKESSVINQTTTDSIALTKLVRAVYEWHNTTTVDDFPYQYDEKQDSIFVGIDWDTYQDNIVLFKQTGFFSQDFLEGHKDIAKTLDTSIRKAASIWRNSNDGISLWETGADNWCGCQDYPEKYWELLTIDSLVINQDKADFIWTWDTDFSHSYRVKAIKEEGKWKIKSLDGFKYFYTVAEYDKMMIEE